MDITLLPRETEAKGPKKRETNTKKKKIRKRGSIRERVRNNNVCKKKGTCKCLIRKENEKI